MHTGYHHFSTYYGLVLACTLLSNDDSADFRRDAKAIIDFYCRAYGRSAADAEQWESEILGTLAQVNLLDDREAIYSRRVISRDYREEDVILDVKGDVLAEISAKYSGHSIFVNPAWFDYTHVHRYQPEVRFAQMRAAASSGWVAAARQVGIMLALGIGCAADVDAAIYKFEQCLYWCDVPSCYMLAHLYRERGETAKTRYYADLAFLLGRYLTDGITVVPSEAFAHYDREAIAKYALLSSIFRDICSEYNRADIDYSFVEVMMNDALDYNQKMQYVNEYDKKQWKNESNPVRYANSHIGFSGGNP